MPNEKPFAVADCETNPFRYGVPVSPFAWGLYDGSSYHLFWGDNATSEFLAHVRSLENPHILYGHNAGKFDWLFLAKEFRGNIKIIGSRIVQAIIGIHEFRDSFANIPVPLRDFGNKQEIDYSIMEPFVREKRANRALIEDYLKQDCVGLWHAIERYRAMFGNALTMPTASMKQLNETCTGKPNGKIYEPMTAEQDAVIRPFFYGGRVECFSKGIVENVGPIKIFDVTSMYPSVMRNYAHPISSGFTQRNYPKGDIKENTDFIQCEGFSRGAFSIRTKYGLRFPHASGEFFTTGAEFRHAISLGLFTPTRIISTYVGHDHIQFKTFIDRFWNLRAQATIDEDVMLRLFYKLVMNSAYGKFAQNPEDYQDLIALPEGEMPDGKIVADPDIRPLPHDDPKRLAAYHIAATMPGVVVWGRKAANAKNSYLNVATAASITGHARATLMVGLANAENPLYCDTDCIICSDLRNVTIGSDLGQWKLEATGDTIAIGGKKQYALFSDGKCIKSASKGVRLTADQIYAIAQGREITYQQEAPVIRLRPNPKKQIGDFQESLTRKVRSTAFVELPQ